MKKYVELELEGKTLAGFHHQNNNKNVVVMFHGFTGNKTENKRLFKRLSDELETRGFDIVRFDYFGHGESDGQFSDMTFSNLLKQCERVLDYVQSFNYDDISVLGFSMGGLLSLHLLQPYMKRVVLISPAVDFKKNINLRFDDSSKLIPNGNFDMNGLELGNKFRESLQEVDVLQHKNTYLNPMLFVVGDKDAAVSHDEVVRVSNNFPNSLIHILKDCDHLYSSLPLQKTLQTLIIDFLIRNS